MKNFLMGLALLLQPNFSKNEMEKSEYEGMVHLDSSDGIKNAFNSSLVIQSIRANGSLASGSGNLLKIYGREVIMTAYHVIEESESIVAFEKNGNLSLLKLIYYDEEKDIAVLLPQNKLPVTSAVKIKLRDDNLIGKDVYHCGHPSVVRFNLSRGMITSYGVGYYVIDSFSLPGSSGSVVFGENGDVVGVVVALPITYYSIYPQMVDSVVLISSIESEDVRKIKEALLNNK